MRTLASAALFTLIDEQTESAIVTKVIISNHGMTVKQVEAERGRKWAEWVETHSPKKQNAFDKEQLSDMPELVDTTVYYLEMLANPQRTVQPPRNGLMVLHDQSPSVAYYRFLYDAVGEDYNWRSRRKLSDDELAAILGDPGNELHVLHVDGSPAGFAEFDRRQPDDIELVQFGLLGDFIGKGLGTWFLQQTIDKVWGYQPKRLWLHTCTLDHPAAVPMYKQAGFVQFKEEVIRREL